jgi:SAM-dependent methyltransferase
MGGQADVWGVGGAYERYIGRWSRMVAREFVAWLEPPGGGRWLDVGCGTGALTRTVLDRAGPELVAGVDPSAGFVADARERMGGGRAAFAVGDARRLPVRDGAADWVVSGLVLNFVPEPERAVAELARVLRPGGRAGVYLWDYDGGIELISTFWEVAGSLDQAAPGLDEARRFAAFNRPDTMVRLFTAAGLDGVETRSIEIPTRFADFDDYWEPFLGGQGPAPAYLAGLDEDRRAAIREALRERLPAGPDGSIELRARAWAARGVSAGGRTPGRP